VSHGYAEGYLKHANSEIEEFKMRLNFSSSIMASVTPRIGTHSQLSAEPSLR